MRNVALFGLMGDVSSVAFKPIWQSGSWRVEIRWPNQTPRYFGKFTSRTEAEKWIEEHHWLTKQPQEPDVKPWKGRMTAVKWTIKGREFAHCNCAYGCPCQFNAPPTYGYCKALVGIVIDSGYHGDTKLDGVKLAGVFSFPGAIHEGRGEAFVVVDESATLAQREAVFRIISGQDTEPGATFFQVFSSMLEKVHDPIFARVDLEVDVDGRKARLNVPDLIEARGETILNPVTKEPHRARVTLPDGFEYTTAEFGRGWGKTFGPIKHDLNDSHAHFCNLHLTGSGVVR
jgi:hypothetical protein